MTMLFYDCQQFNTFVDFSVFSHKSYGQKSDRYGNANSQILQL